MNTAWLLFQTVAWWTWVMFGVALLAGWIRR